jgi:predicted Zn-dependent protease
MSEMKLWGEWVYDQIASEAYIESSGWAVERVERVLSRLQADRTEEDRFQIVVPWLQVFTAFISPGNYIFFCRPLLEMCRDDEMTAFVIAHEIAHSDLGHIDLFPKWLTKLTGKQIAPFLTMFYRNLEQRLYGPEQECEADKHGIELCIKVGYDPEKCLAVFDVLEKYALDMGDLSSVFGLQESDGELLEDASLLTKLKIWLFQKSRGYLPIRDRREMLHNHLKSRLKTSEFSN